MSCRSLSLFLFITAALLLNSPLLAAEDADKNSHVGTFVSAESEDAFTMADDKDKEHSHTMAAGAKVIGADGKPTKLTALKKGQKIRVHTKEGDASTATKVEVLKE
jgi:hypothetical protein